MENNLSGRLLVASPYLSDGNFMRSVVFIVKHGIEGAFGLAINRPSNKRFGELLEVHETEGKPRDDDWIYRGGPVRGPLLALHSLAGIGEPCGISYPDDIDESLFEQGADLSDSDDIDIGSCSFESASASGVDHPPAWVTGDEDHLRILLRRCDAHVRFIVDYSGWGKGQLDEELKQGGWLVCDASPELLFGDHNTVWESAVKQCGHEVLATMAPGIRFGDPTLN